MNRLPIRVRLTVWYSLMFATVALLLGFTSWWMLRRTLDVTIHQDLQERIDDVSSQLRLWQSHGPLEDPQAQFDSIYRPRDDGKWLQIIDQDGHWLYRSARFATLNFPLRLPTSLPPTGEVNDISAGLHSIRTFSSRIVVDGRAYSVMTGISMNKSKVLLHDFGLGLLFLTPAMVIVAALGGYVMSRKALAPVEVIAREARRITDKNLDSRLPVSVAGDELSHLSTTLNLMLGRIEMGFRSVREFTANASHELRTPLARLRTEAEIALFRPRTEGEYRRALELIHLDAVDMSYLIESLLTLARAEVGTESLRLGLVDLRDVVTAITTEWAPVAQHLSIEWNVLGTDPLERESVAVLGDRLTLLRLLRIFLDNACKFTPSGGNITLFVDITDDTVRLAVRDSGIGIAAENHTRIFQRFYRVEGDATQDRKGAGLGLSLASWIAEQHQTHIVVTSGLGQGSCFEISLMRVPNDDGRKHANTDTAEWTKETAMQSGSRF